ncbi:MAG: FAD binding domain-containing protein [Thermoproteus sp.]|nr:FAD binding domain-containing protein [Thermoproteus sp.]
MYVAGYPLGFKYWRPTSLEEALSLLRELDGEVKPLAGGQSLMALLKLRLVKADHLVDIFHIDELKYIKWEGGALRIGALATHNVVAMSKAVVEAAPLLSEAAWHIADLQVRNLGTIGGSLAHADPAANYLPALAAAKAVVAIRGPGGTREVPADAFYKGPYAPDLSKGELVVEASVRPWFNASGFYAVKLGGAAYPSAVAAFVARLEDGVVAESRAAIGAVYASPQVIEGLGVGMKAEDLARGAKALAERAVKEIAEPPIPDAHAPAEYKARLAAAALARAVEGAFSRRRLPARDGVEPLRGAGPVDSADGRVKVKLTVNGVLYEDWVEPRTLLLDYLRSKGVGEVRRGCDEGKCGACTVLMDGRAVKSCMITAAQASGRSITTMRGLMRGGELHPIQRAFVEEYALQCGWCTHGFMAAVHDYLTNIDGDADDETLRLSVRNICRCTGYVQIIKAIKKAAERMRGGPAAVLFRQ